MTTEEDEDDDDDATAAYLTLNDRPWVKGGAKQCKQTRYVSSAAPGLLTIREFIIYIYMCTI